jgi:TDG/mug DNA glycosylase family protein
MSVLDDVLRPGLRIVFCGSAVGAASALRQAYYAGPGNQFWPILFRAGFTDRQLAPEKYRTLVEFGIGLTDINKIESGNDRSLTRSASDAAGLHAKILQFAPTVLAFNGKRSAQAYFGPQRKPLHYGLQPETIGQTQIFVLPSTSGAARGFWDESHWHALARIVA